MLNEEIESLQALVKDDIERLQYERDEIEEQLDSIFPTEAKKSSPISSPKSGKSTSPMTTKPTTRGICESNDRQKNATASTLRFVMLQHGVLQKVGAD